MRVICHVNNLNNLTTDSVILIDINFLMLLCTCVDQSYIVQLCIRDIISVLVLS